MRYISVDQINDLSKTACDFVESCDVDYDAMIMAAAAQILRNSPEKPLVLLSGPSGSGKTTTALRIERLLDAAGHATHTLSMDNYFYRRADGVVPLDDEGKIDYESPDCLDIGLLSEHMQKIADCEEIDVPSFDFANQRRTDITTKMHRGKGEIVILEGIHALNPKVTGAAQRFSTCVFISVNTTVVLGDFQIEPERIRLLRRLMRDEVGRGQSYEETIARLPSVSRGERLYIYPHRGNADIVLDTFIPYELPVYRDRIVENLKKVDSGYLLENGHGDLLAIMEKINPIGEEIVAKNALIREFIGGIKL